MKPIWLTALLLAPLAAGVVAFEHNVEVDSASQAPFAPLSSGDQGTATIGTSQTSASVTVAAVAIQIADDILDITSSDASWQVHAQYVSHTGFTAPLLSPSFTLSLRDGTSSINQIRIVNGAATITSGAPVDLPAHRDTELFGIASLGAAGTVQLQLILSKDSGVGPVVRYDINIVVI